MVLVPFQWPEILQQKNLQSTQAKLWSFILVTETLQFQVSFRWLKINKQLQQLYQVFFYSQIFGAINYSDFNHKLGFQFSFYVKRFIVQNIYENSRLMVITAATLCLQVLIYHHMWKVNHQKFHLVMLNSRLTAFTRLEKGDI
jgi:hypothetical protein